ncbi:unnamed protein product [Auanema sp. JU1783]|nr:unnamed protein product [Auanema sp. JU1783]
MASSNKTWTFNGYREILASNLTIDTLRQLCYDGLLRKSVLRSLVWRIMLNCLPVCKLEWKTILHRSRAEYDKLRKIHITDPHDESFSQDPQENNPLTQTDQNPWQKYFEDHDLRDIISKDVMRTFPEISFFQQANIRESMSEILIVYAKQHPYISYKQGMHEILAPLLFVLCSDIELFEHMKEGPEFGFLNEEDKKILENVYDRKHFVHDTYILFREVMLEIGTWYEDSELAGEKPKSNEPFLRMHDAVPSTMIALELSKVGDCLHSYDPELSSHLKNLDIPPQLFGIRWLRLLFGREFPIHDLLFIWDIIFCERPIVRMVQSVFIAMLIYIRELLLKSDYGGCLHYLMKYPPVVDITVFMQLARHFNCPKKIGRPNLTALSNFANITVAGVAHPNTQKEFVVPKNAVPAMRPRQRSVFEKMKETLIENTTQKTSPQATPKKGGISGCSSPADKGGRPWGKELELMENQVACLQSALNEKDVLCSDVAKRMDTCADKLNSLNSVETAKTVAIELRQLSARLTNCCELQSLRKN